MNTMQITNFVQQRRRSIDALLSTQRKLGPSIPLAVRQRHEDPHALYEGIKDALVHQTDPLMFSRVKKMIKKRASTIQDLPYSSVRGSHVDTFQGGFRYFSTELVSLPVMPRIYTYLAKSVQEEIIRIKVEEKGLKTYQHAPKSSHSMIHRDNIYALEEIIKNLATGQAFFVPSDDRYISEKQKKFISISDICRVLEALNSLGYVHHHMSEGVTLHTIRESWRWKTWLASQKFVDLFLYCSRSGISKKDEPDIYENLEESGVQQKAIEYVSSLCEEEKREIQQAAGRTMEEDRPWKDICLLRDEDKKIITVDEMNFSKGHRRTRVLSHLKKEGVLLNKLSRELQWNHDIRIPTLSGRGEKLSTCLHTVYNNGSIDQGGRIYSHIATMRSGKRRSHSKGNEAYRLMIQIDGQDVVELDYTAIHPTLLAIRSGLPYTGSADLYKEIVDELLKDEVEELRNSFLVYQEVRKIVKIAFQICINTKDIRAAKSGVLSSIIDNFPYVYKNMPARDSSDRFIIPVLRRIFTRETIDKNTGEVKNSIYTKRVVDAIMNRFTAEDGKILIGQGDVYGLFLQNLDAQIAKIVMKKMVLEHGQACLPIHDSFIVARDQEALLHKIMVEAFIEVMTKDTGKSAEELKQWIQITSSSLIEEEPVEELLAIEEEGEELVSPDELVRIFSVKMAIQSVYRSTDGLRTRPVSEGLRDGEGSITSRDVRYIFEHREGDNIEYSYSPPRSLLKDMGLLDPRGLRKYNREDTLVMMSKIISRLDSINAMTRDTICTEKQFIRHMEFVTTQREEGFRRNRIRELGIPEDELLRLKKEESRLKVTE